MYSRTIPNECGTFKDQKPAKRVKSVPQNTRMQTMVNNIRSNKLFSFFFFLYWSALAFVMAELLLFFPTLDTNKNTYTHSIFNDGSRTMKKFKNQTRTKNEKSETITS